MKVRHRILALALACAGFAACERVAAPGDEVATELRALRLALHEARPPAVETSAAAPREAIDAALRPLRDVLTQLGNSQRELATRQVALTQELQRWTQLVVSTMQEKSAEQGRGLQQRLEQLEQSMAQQDSRHREVEALLQAALDNTATHLEDFLRRLEQVAPREPVRELPPGAAPQANPSPGEGPSNGNGTAGGAPAGDPPHSPDPAARQGASRWPWWLLAAAAVLMGIRLLLPRRRVPVRVAPEMRADAAATPEEAPVAPADLALAEPEVEELWAAAALLGEAIGKIKQSANPAEVERLLGKGLGDPEQGNPLAVPLEVPPEPPEYSLPPFSMTPAGDVPVAGTVDETEDWSEAPDRAAFDDDEVFVLDDEAGSFELLVTAEQPPAGTAISPHRPPSDRAFELPRPIAVDTGPESVTWRLPVRDVPRAELAVRELLDADPRVLVLPAPQVRPSVGELCVVFALLPGLPAGERSQLEQRLRDAVA